MLTLLLSLLIPAASAAPKADLTVSISPPSSTPAVYDDATYTVEVENAGRRHAQNVSLTIQLPETNSSPSVYILGELSNPDSRCTESGTALVCSLGRVRAGQRASVSFDLALPWSADPLIIDAEASTSTAESSLSNNTDLIDAEVSYVDIVISGPQDVTNTHCTGTGLAAYYTCSLFPSSLSSHTATLESDGSISFPYPGYGGSWSQASDDALSMVYTSGGSVVAEFEGNGVDGTDGCFEGLTTFPGSSYVSPYRVCLD